MWQIMNGAHSVYRSMQSKPVVALPYEPKQWNIRQTIQILGASNKLGLRDCIWQLGSGMMAFLLTKLCFLN